jgi:SAM-dependent methyltransferase
MNERTYEDLVAEAMSVPFTGWDMSWLMARAPITRSLPWSYPLVVAGHAARAGRMLDMGTGGGELLLQLPARALVTVADEAWGPNVPIAGAALLPRAIPVVQDEGASDNFDQDGIRGRLPYRSQAFDLVINRHESFLASEVLRVLRPGGNFVTQQVDWRSRDELYLALNLEPPTRAGDLAPSGGAPVGIGCGSPGVTIQTGFLLVNGIARH